MMYLIDLWGLLWGTWTDFFAKILGPNAGNVFFIVPIMVLAMGLWFKNPEKPMMPMVFIIGSCAILGTGHLFVNSYGVGAFFLIVCALGLTKLVLDVVFNRGNG